MQVELLDTRGFTFPYYWGFCTYSWLQHHHALGRCPAGRTASASPHTPLFWWQNQLWLEREPRGNRRQGMRWLWWPEEPVRDQRASPSACGAKGERCKAGGPLVQGFGLGVGQWGGKIQTRWPGGSLQDSSNTSQPNIVTADFYTGSCSQFQGKDTLFGASPYPATSPDLLMTCTWLCDGCSVSRPPFFCFFQHLQLYPRSQTLRNVPKL